jgi:biopolymer transport protein ExbB
MENAMAEMLEQQSTTLLRKIEWLNIIGAVAPMIGLFGTVWGMIEAFNRIVYAHGQPEPDQLAGAISIALVTTLWGLFAAIPALAAYGSLRNRIDALSAEAALAAEDLIRRIKHDNITQNQQP